MTDQIHVFEIAGLGKAPFQFTGCSEIVFVAPGAAPRAGGTCDYCGTCIRYACWILSADGKKHKVGTDCICKSGDKGLRSKAKEAKKKIIAEKRREQALAETEARHAAERLIHGGVTGWERQAANMLHQQWIQAEAMKPAKSVLAELGEEMIDGKGGFCDSVGTDMINGAYLTAGQARVAGEILAKQAGRKNSKAWKARHAVISAIIDECMRQISDAYELSYQPSGEQE